MPIEEDGHNDTEEAKADDDVRHVVIPAHDAEVESPMLDVAEHTHNREEVGEVARDHHNCNCVHGPKRIEVVHYQMNWWQLWKWMLQEVGSWTDCYSFLDHDEEPMVVYNNHAAVDNNDGKNGEAMVVEDDHNDDVVMDDGEVEEGDTPHTNGWEHVQEEVDCVHLLHVNTKDPCQCYHCLVHPTKTPPSKNNHCSQ
jgi:hypothetical protein